MAFPPDQITHETCGCNAKRSTRASLYRTSARSAPPPTPPPAAMPQSRCLLALASRFAPCRRWPCNPARRDRRSPVDTGPSPRGRCPGAPLRAGAAPLDLAAASRSTGSAQPCRGEAFRVTGTAKLGLAPPLWRGVARQCAEYAGLGYSADGPARAWRRWWAPPPATTLNNLAGGLQEQGDLTGARERFERALAIDKAVYGPDHHDVATDRTARGMTFRPLLSLPGLC